MKQAVQKIDMDVFADFLSETEWESAEVIPLSLDMGNRLYFKLALADKEALLMDMSRSGLESGLKEYIEIDEYLAELGIRVPEIYHYNLDTGFAIIENLGDKSYGDCLREGKDRSALYPVVTNVLIQLKEKASKNDLGLVDFEKSVPRQKLNFFSEHYMPSASGHAYKPEDLVEFNKIFDGIKEKAPACAKIFAHADYHLENFIWIEDAPEPYGLIDFQDAMWIEQPYDLVNLLEDARQDVPQDIKDEMRALYCDGMSAEERTAFDAWYIILSMTFHIKVIGQLVKYYNERGMDQYISFIPRLQAYIKKNLEEPIMAPLKTWLEEKNVSFDIPLDELLKKS